MASLPAELEHRTPPAPTWSPSLPEYDRARLTPAVVHLGVGGFHRAHQAVYFDELARRGVSLGWGIIGVSLRRSVMKQALEPQDCLYTVLERGGLRERARVIGVLTRILCAPDEPEAVLAALSDERTRLVTLTVTGDGYGVERTTGRFDARSAEVAEQLRDPARPITGYAYLVEALARRRAAGLAPFTVLSCDNLPDNGAAARSAVVGFARLRDPQLADWIDAHVTFPSSVVDRITPRASDADREGLRLRFGVVDRCPVVTEPYSQWIVEDAFCNGRPPLDEVGVTFVSDVRPHKLIKTRLLNGTHTALGPLGVLAGHRTIDRTLRDPVFAHYAEDLMRREVAPLLPELPGMALEDYQRTLLRRFANPAVADPLARLCERGSTKIPSYLVPSLVEALERGSDHSLLTLALAGWMRFYRGVDGRGSRFEIHDALADTLQAQARAMGDDPRVLLSHRDVFGDLRAHPGFVAALRRALCDLDAFGPRAAVAAHVSAGRMALAA